MKPSGRSTGSAIGLDWVRQEKIEGREHCGINSPRRNSRTRSAGFVDLTDIAVNRPAIAPLPTRLLGDPENRRRGVALQSCARQPSVAISHERLRGGVSYFASGADGFAAVHVSG